MVQITSLFWVFVLLCGVVGGLRGWAKEILVLFSMVLALFISNILRSFVPGFLTAMDAQQPLVRFWLWSAFFLVMAFFGYQSPSLSGYLAQKTAMRDRLQNGMLGACMGMLNGYLLVGTIWYHLHITGYPTGLGVTPPDNVIQNLVATYMQYMPPVFIGSPLIYFLVAICFIFIIVVFI